MVFMRVLVVSSALMMMVMTMAMTMILLSANTSPTLQLEWNSGNWRGRSMARRLTSSQRDAMLTSSRTRKRQGLDYRTLNQPIKYRKLLATPQPSAHGTSTISVTISHSSFPPSTPSTTKNPSKDTTFLEDYNAPQTHPPKNN